jgi:hypothetical protein
MAQCATWKVAPISDATIDVRQVHPSGRYDIEEDAH